MPNKNEPRVAIVADWLNNLGGAETVIKSLCDLYPSADIYTSVYDKEGTSGHFAGRNVYTSFLQKIPGAKNKHQLFSKWRPYAFENFDLSSYDIVISSSSAEAKGVITKPETLHICYCHTPTRYYWSDYHEYKNRMEFGILNPLAKLVMPLWIHKLRIWDFIASQRPDAWIGNSNYVKKRIWKYYRKDASVIHPPVNTSRFTYNPKGEKEDYFFAASRAIPYKRLDIAVDAATMLGIPLKVAGSGPMLEDLQRRAGASVQILGRISDEEMEEHMQKAKAFIFPPEEDFGITPLEAMAAGTPVIAYGKGGAKDYVVPGLSGEFFETQTPDALANVMKTFDINTYKPEKIRTHAEKFSETNFHKTFAEFVNAQYEKIRK